MQIFNVFNDDEVNKMRQFISKLKFQDGKETARGSAKEIKRNFQITTQNADAMVIFNATRQLILNNPMLSSYTFAKEVVGQRVASYKDDGYYGWHVDMAFMNQHRTDMSFTLCLSDNYEGGELELDYGSHKKVVKLKKGEMVIYPTGILHQVKPVTQGERLVIVGWIESLIADAENREVLFKLANEIIRLKQNVDNPQELNQLNYILQYFRRKLAVG